MYHQPPVLVVIEDLLGVGPLVTVKLDRIDALRQLLPGTQ
jgi:hypothetical protein